MHTRFHILITSKTERDQPHIYEQKITVNDYPSVVLYQTKTLFPLSAIAVAPRAILFSQTALQLYIFIAFRTK